MSTPFEGIIASSAVPPWLPRDAQEARKFSYWAHIMFLLVAFIWFMLGIAWFAIGLANGHGGDIALGFFALIMAIICGLSGVVLRKSVIDEIDHGRFLEAKNASVFWLIIGIAAFALPTILLFMTWSSLTTAMAPPPGYAPYPPGTVVAQQPYQPAQYPAQQPQQAPQYQQPAASYQAPQYSQPAPQAYPPPGTPAGPPGTDHKYPMHKCKNCNVQYPAFMANCPNCGAPRT